MMNDENPDRAKCRVCRWPAEIGAGGEAVHRGGGVLMQKCLSCGWAGTKYVKRKSCPTCGSKDELVDDHYLKL